jgi:cytochrome P450
MTGLERAMSEIVTAESAERALAINLPPATRLPKVVQGLAFAINRRKFVARMVPRHGTVFTCDAPVFGRTVMVADPQIAKQLFAANTDAVGNIQPNLSRVLGKGSVFALDGSEHRLRRKLLTPPFHGKSVKNYERIFEEEALREAASWPQGQAFGTLEPMMRITLNAILRAVFGADDEHLDELRRIIPPWVTLGSRLAVLPMPARRYGRYSPWGRLAAYRRQYDEVVGRLIDNVAADPHLDSRDDVLALLLRSTYEDGTAMAPRDIADELLTLLAAGHETTAATLAWTFERISRHPHVLRRLEEEVVAGADEFRQAVILEVQRVRTIIDFAGRHVYASTLQLGDWVIPRGFSVVVAIDHMHEDATEFADPERFDPERFVGHRPPLAFLPFGGGTRRCVGAVFAHVEMDVVLRTVLRHFAVETTSATGEKVHPRGVAYTPKNGGRVVLRRRTTPL